MENVENRKICSKCGGKCCNTLPGCYSSEDFERNGVLDIDRIKQELNSHQVAIDWWEGDPRGLVDGDEGFVSEGYFLRPSTIEDYETKRTYSPTWGGKCIFLKEFGCEVPLLDRPKECRVLEPFPESKCVPHFSKQDAALSWLKYYDILDTIGQS